MRIHMLGIGGTGMGSLAGLLCEAGHTVTGSDETLYPPMSTQIAELGIKLFEGYYPENLDEAKPDMVIIGNVIRRENPEAQEVLRRGLRYQSMPEAICDLFLQSRTSIVITGTHGKTTSSTLAAWLLSDAGERPGYLIGGVGLNFKKSFAVGSPPFFVIEGDEYDTAFFDKGPKFLHYRPQVALITSIEFDHADIYKNLDAIKESFKKLIAIIPPDGLLVVNSDDENADSLAKNASCRVVTYGLNSGAYRPTNISASSEGTRFDIEACAPLKTFMLPMWGTHNILNTVGVIAILHESGIPTSKLISGLTGFKGVRRRQELMADIKDVIIVDDFAHHPTAVEKTIESMRLRFPKRRLWAIFEPRSNTSRRNIFQDGFVKALSKADRVIVASPHKLESIPLEERFDSDAVAALITKTGKDAHHIADTIHIVEYVMRCVQKDDVILVMSNGGFNGLIGKLTDALTKRKTVV